MCNVTTCNFTRRKFRVYFKDFLDSTTLPSPAVPPFPSHPLLSLLSLPSPLSHPFQFPPLPSPYRSRPLNPATGLGERCKLPQRGPSRILDFGAF